MEDFTLYTEALALKELGFDEPCFTTYDNEGRLRNPFDCIEDYDDNVIYIEDTTNFVTNSELTLESFTNKGYNPEHFQQFVAAPLYQQAFRWFREKYRLYSEITLDSYKEPYSLKVNIKHLDSTHTFVNKEYLPYSNGIGDIDNKNYEEAELACLKKLIEIVKNDNKSS